MRLSKCLVGVVLVVGLVMTGRGAAAVQVVGEPAGGPVLELVPGETFLISVGQNGEQGDAQSDYGTLSPDGRYLSFHSKAGNLVPGDTNGTRDVFLIDRQTGELTLISRNLNGEPGNEDSAFASLSYDGSVIAFHAVAGDLVAGDTNGVLDVFIYEQATGEIERISVSTAGVEGDNDSFFPDISADGRYVTYYGNASTLVPGDTNGLWDIFFHDRQTGITERISEGPAGEQGDSISTFPHISADGRYISFDSLATNLVPGDTNGVQDIFIHDRQTGLNQRVSLGPGGVQADGGSFYPDISANGRFVTFSSHATNLVPGDTNGVEDIFVYDQVMGTMERVSVSAAGEQSNGHSHYPTLSGDGRFVGFDSDGDNLVPGDSNGVRDAFIHDRLTGRTIRISVDSAGQQGDGPSSDVVLSEDGRIAMFHSPAGNLAPGDTNGLNDVFMRYSWLQVQWLPGLVNLE